jgi:cytochrome c peroxidase
MALTFKKPNWRTVVACLAALGGLRSAGAQQPAFTPAAAKIQAGRFWFHDSRMSIDNTTSCASCHSAKHGFSDGRQVAIGLIGSQQSPTGFKGTRHSPTVLNIALNKTLGQERVFWDGRTKDLFTQAGQPQLNPLEMGNNSMQQVANRFAGLVGYQQLMSVAYGDSRVTPDRMQECLVAFESTLVAVDTPLRRYLEGNTNALPTRGGKRGAAIFNRDCMECHKPPLFTTGKFANTGIESMAGNDPGLQKTTGKQADARCYKIPSLIAVSMREPLMHNGSMSLDRAIDHYGSGGRYYDPSGQLVMDTQIDERVKRLSYTADQRKDLKEAIGPGLNPFDYPRQEIVPTPEEMPQ